MNKREKLILGGVYLVLFGISSAIDFNDIFGWHWKVKSLTEAFINSGNCAIIFLGMFLIFTNINWRKNHPL